LALGAVEAAVNVCYYTNWAQYRPGLGKFTPDNIDPHLCTHINYAFAFVTDDGTGLNPFEWNDFTEWGDGGMYKRVNDWKKVNKELKVVLSVGGWTHGTGGFTPASATASARQTFANNALEFVSRHNFDGIDVDWEYPGYVTHPSKPGIEADVENHVLLLQKLSAVFHGAGKIVTAAVGAPPSRVDESYPSTGRICDALDMVHLMTYDFHGGWESVMGHHSAFITDGNHPDDEHATWTVRSSVNYWLEKGCPAEKLTLGFGSYGRGWKATTTELSRLAPGTSRGFKGQYTREDGFMAYYELCNWESSIDETTKGAVAIDAKNALWAGFETVESADIKLDFAVEKRLGGIMWWALDMDDFNGEFCNQGKYPLISTVWRNYQTKLGQNPTSPPPSTIKKTTQETTTEQDETTMETTTETRPRPTTTMRTTTRTTTSRPLPPNTDDLAEYCKIKGDGIWASPGNCGNYVQCVHGGSLAIERSCQVGLLWDDERKVCNWPQNVDCDNNAESKRTTTRKSTTKDSRPTNAPQDLSNFCRTHAVSFAPVPADCSKYIQCDQGKTLIRTCPAGLVWNDRGFYCDWPSNVPTC